MRVINKIIDVIGDRSCTPDATKFMIAMKITVSAIHIGGAAGFPCHFLGVDEQDLHHRTGQSHHK